MRESGIGKDKTENKTNSKGIKDERKVTGFPVVQARIPDFQCGENLFPSGEFPFISCVEHA